ncbi:MAG: hypothetical protein R6V83_09230 [Candidatus Thorarchaeota archaeon]
MGDHDHAVARTVEDFTVTGVMCLNNDRRQKPGPREGHRSDERGQSPC